MSSKILVAITLALILTACASKKVVNESNVHFTENKIININMNWIKDKGSKFDFEMTVSNTSEKDIIIFLSDIACYRGTSRGILKHTFFNTGERTIDFKKGEQKQFKMVCKVGKEVDGDFKINIDKVFDNPSGDGKIKGEQIGQSIEWSGHL